MGDNEDPPDRLPGQGDGGLDLRALRRRAADALDERLYEGYRTKHPGEPRPVDVPPLVEGGRGTLTLRDVALRWTTSLFPATRRAALADRGCDLELSPGDRLVVFHRAITREGMRERIRARRSVKPLRNAITEEATRLVTGATWGTRWSDDVEPLEAPAADPTDLERRAWRRVLAAQALDEVEASPRARKIWKLFAEGYKYREIGDMMGISPGTVGKHLSRFRAALRRWAREQGVTPT